MSTGSIRQRAPGTWEIQWYVGRENGKDRYRSKTVGKKNAPATKRQAREELNRIIHEIQNGTYAHPTKMSVAEYLRQWLNDYALVTVAGTTYERYASIVEKHLIPALGYDENAKPRLLHKLEPKHIQTYYAEALRSGRVNPLRDEAGKVVDAGLSPRSVQQSHAILRKALKCAVRWGYLGRNVADMVDPPRVPQKQSECYSEDEVKALVASTEGTAYGPMVLIAASTGMRLGEILALTWDDIDRNTGAIAVTKALEETKDCLKVKEPKSARGRRTIPIPEDVLNRLLAYQEQQEAEAEARKKVWQDNGLVCPDATGNYRKPGSISSIFRDIAKRAGVRQLGIHKVRHFHATYLASKGWAPHEVQERLGHSTIAVTMNIYTHVVPESRRQKTAELKGAFCQ